MNDMNHHISEFDQYALNYWEQLEHPLRRIVSSKGNYFLELKAEEIQIYLHQMGIVSEGLILGDVGSGLSTLDEYLQGFFKNIISMDLSLEMLRVAQKISGLTNGKYACSDVVSLPIETNTFDITVMSCVFHHMPHELIVLGLQEMKRVTREGGLIIVFEHNPWNLLTQLVVKTTPLDKNARLISQKKLAATYNAAGIKILKQSSILFGPRGLDQTIRNSFSILRKLPIGGQYFILGEG